MLVSNCFFFVVTRHWLHYHPGTTTEDRTLTSSVFATNEPCCWHANPQPSTPSPCELYLTSLTPFLTTTYNDNFTANFFELCTVSKHDWLFQLLSKTLTERLHPNSRFPPPRTITCCLSVPGQCLYHLPTWRTSHPVQYRQLYFSPRYTSVISLI